MEKRGSVSSTKLASTFYLQELKKDVKLFPSSICYQHSRFSVADKVYYNSSSSSCVFVSFRNYDLVKVNKVERFLKIGEK